MDWRWVHKIAAQSNEWLFLIYVDSMHVMRCSQT